MLIHKALMQICSDAEQACSTGEIRDEIASFLSWASNHYRFSWFHIPANLLDGYAQTLAIEAARTEPKGVDLSVTTSQGTFGYHVPSIQDALELLTKMLAAQAKDRNFNPDEVFAPEMFGRQS